MEQGSVQLANFMSGSCGILNEVARAENSHQGKVKFFREMSVSKQDTCMNAPTDSKSRGYVGCMEWGTLKRTVPACSPFSQLTINQAVVETKTSRKRSRGGNRVHIILRAAALYMACRAGAVQRGQVGGVGSVGSGSTF